MPAGRERQVNELSSALFTATVQDEAGNAIAGDDLDTLALTVHVEDENSNGSGEIINSRSGVDVLNTNDVTVDAAGLLTWKVQAADNPIVGTNVAVGASERHVALFEWTWNDGSDDRAGKAEVIIFVKNLGKVSS